MRGYFAIGVEGLSKPMNFGNLARSAHAFGASFLFTVDAERKFTRPGSDTSSARGQLPYYAWSCIDEMRLPTGCKLVGVEFIEEAVELPSFGHPIQAAYVMGPERGSLSPTMRRRCDHTIRIPTAFCINVATAGAIVMYDRIRVGGRFAERPVASGGPREPVVVNMHGSPVFRRKRSLPDAVDQ
jgi:tRNA G18 (ribose-2'-O)-methylase SpoU